ncbi:putative serine/threonine-protein kinase [Prosopis cineraria]|uniref:putative serine/threonine-protein kinase n=1 Tax=Prosopis cineraria TaxID=364024 RepID=UPI00240EB8D2|nr:putative serine/threonine-protein kinase [Prosopis cineraria]
MKIPRSFLTCFSATVEEPRQLDDPEGGGDEAFRVFHRSELKLATRGFNSWDKIGEGGFGSVYKGQLRNGNVVAVKVLSVELESMRGEMEFAAELATLSRINHENLVSLRGCCVEEDRRYLVFNYMENNSLSRTFLGTEECRMKFRWELRSNISVGVARGLAYLHEQLKPHIVHRDIKPSNILLDQNFTPKLSDFGFAKLFTDEKSYVSTRVAGTLGYIAPEYATTGKLTRKSDVYSFGVLLLQIVSGQAAVDAYQDMDRFLVEKVWAAYKANELVKMVDPVITNMNSVAEEGIRFLKVGLLCVQETAKLRPRMTEVVEMLTSSIFNDMEGVAISKPGFVADLRNIKIRQQIPIPVSPESISSGANQGIWRSAVLAR